MTFSSLLSISFSPCSKTLRSNLRGATLAAGALTVVFLGAACAENPERLNDRQPGSDGELNVGEGNADLPEPEVGGDGDAEIGDNHNDNGDGDGDVVTDPVYTLSVVSGAVTVITGATEEVTIQVVNENGNAISDASVSLNLSSSAAVLNLSATTTDATGRAQVNITGVTVGSVTLTAQTEYAAALAVPVQVNLPPAGSLQVNLVRATSIAVSETDLFAWIGDTAPACAAVEAGTANAVPTETLSIATLPQSQTFAGLPHGSEATVFAVAYAQSGVVLASACRAGLVVTGGQTTTASLTLSQNPTVIDGDYDVLMRLSLGQALPEPYETYVNTTTAVLSDPAGYAAYQALKALDKDWGTSFIAWDQAATPPYASYEEVASNAATFGTWTLARDYLEAELSQRLGQGYDDLTTVGGDIRDLVTDFEVGARFSVTETGPGQVNITENWNALVFEWNLGCPSGDQGCARRAIETEDLALSATDSNYGGLFDVAPSSDESERYRVRGNAHAMSFRYGAVITAAFNQVVFPSLPGDLAADSLSGVFANLIDCAEVGAALANAVGIGTGGMYEGFCSIGLDFAASEIQDQVVSLELGNDNPELSAKDEEGAFGGGEFYLVDEGHDLLTETVQDFTWLVAWNDPADPSASQEISVPMTGAGRLAASRCTADAMCGAGESCQPIAHYLLVQQAENDCLPALGSLGGEQACSSDSECASGLCVTDGSGLNVCFAACATGATCSTGTCGVAESLFDLEPLLTGLGQASAMACGFIAGDAGSLGGMCEESCAWAGDGVCDDGGAGSEYSVCGLGTDCGDCGSR